MKRNILIIFHPADPAQLLVNGRTADAFSAVKSGREWYVPALSSKQPCEPEERRPRRLDVGL